MSLDLLPSERTWKDKLWAPFNSFPVSRRKPSASSFRRFPCVFAFLAVRSGVIWLYPGPDEGERVAVRLSVCLRHLSPPVLRTHTFPSTLPPREDENTPATRSVRGAKASYLRLTAVTYSKPTGTSPSYTGRYLTCQLRPPRPVFNGSYWAWGVLSSQIITL